MRTAKPLNPAACVALVTTDRWLSKVSIPLPPGEGCWLWTGALNQSGYGQILLARRYVQAHRVALVAHLGRDVTPGMQVGHLCHDRAVSGEGCSWRSGACSHRACVNPDHLAEQTARENALSGNRTNQNSVKTHCKRGHPLSGDNLIVRTYSSGTVSRLCAICVAAYNEQRNERRRGEGNWNARKTHCRNGHPLDGDNLIVYVRERGTERVCRTCRDARNKEWYEVQCTTHTSHPVPRCTEDGVQWGCEGR